MSQTTPIPNTLDTPIYQPFYQHLNGTWEPVIPNEAITTTPTNQSTPLHSLRLTTWNIDFRAPCADERMNKALHYLSTIHDTAANNTPSIILLQEMISSDLTLIQQKPWIQERFYITDISAENWGGSGYGTTMLIDKRLDVRDVLRVRYSVSRMGRDVLFVDVRIHGNGPPHQQQQTGDGKQEEKQDSILRIGNTHLESLTSHPPRRPVQLRLAAKFMRGNGGLGESTESTESTGAETRGGAVTLPIPHAAILAGDMNAFAPKDQTLPGECGLQDAFLALSGQDGTEEGYTWGQQRASDKRNLPYSRMDKVLFCGGVEAQSLEKIGAGEKVWIEYPQDSDSEESTDSETGEDLWVTDHIGLQAVFRIMN